MRQCALNPLVDPYPKKELSSHNLMVRSTRCEAVDAARGPDALQAHSIAAQYIGMVPIVTLANHRCLLRSAS